MLLFLSGLAIGGLLGSVIGYWVRDEPDENNRAEWDDSLPAIKR